MNIVKTLIGDVASKAVDVVDQFVTDKDEANKIKASIMQRMQESADAQIKEKSKIIRAEAAGGYLQRNWRPILMLVIVTIVANNYLIAPYLQAMFGPETALSLELPERLWDLMTLGVGGYIAGRSGEKMVERWKA